MTNPFAPGPARVKLPPMNNENDLPPEVQKFLETYLHTDEDRQRFLAEYAAAKSEQDRQAFMARYAQEPADDGKTTAEILRETAAFIESLKTSRSN